MIVEDTRNGNRYNEPEGTLIPYFYRIVDEAEGAKASKATKGKEQPKEKPNPAENKIKAEESKTTKATEGKE